MNVKYMWIVRGTAGEYNEIFSWNVRAFPTSGGAQRYRDKCQVEADRLKKKHRGKNKYDPGCECPCDGVKYSISRISVGG